MPRRLIFEIGSYYHIYNRGANKNTIFNNQEEYLYFLRKVKQYLKGLDVVCYCLMPNHYHMVVRPFSEGALSSFILRLSTSYTQAMNRKYGRSGVLFQGTFKAKHIDNQGGMLHVCRYIHLNPCIAGLSSHPDEWLYSNWHEFTGRRNGSLCSVLFLQILSDLKFDYRAFVLEYLNDYKQDDLVQPYIFDEEE